MILVDIVQFNTPGHIAIVTPSDVAGIATVYGVWDEDKDGNIAKVFAIPGTKDPHVNISTVAYSYTAEVELIDTETTARPRFFQSRLNTLRDQRVEMVMHATSEALEEARTQRMQPQEVFNAAQEAGLEGEAIGSEVGQAGPTSEFVSEDVQSEKA